MRIFLNFFFFEVLNNFKLFELIKVLEKVLEFGDISSEIIKILVEIMIKIIDKIVLIFIFLFF